MAIRRSGKIIKNCYRLDLTSVNLLEVHHAVRLVFGRKKRQKRMRKIQSKQLHTNVLRGFDLCKFHFA